MWSPDFELAITSEAEAIICLMDNSESSRNGDFWPDRLTAQINVVRELSYELERRSAKNRVGFGVIANEIGIVRSLTLPKTVRKDIDALQNRNRIQSAGQPQLGRAIRAALLSLRHGSDDVRTTRVIAMISAMSVDLVTEEQRMVLINALNREKKRGGKRLIVDFIVFAEDLKMEPFEEIRDRCAGIVRLFEFRRTSDTLDDAVMSSGLIIRDDGRRELEDGMDPELRQAIETSLLEDDIAMQQALQASLESMRNNQDKE